MAARYEPITLINFFISKFLAGRICGMFAWTMYRLGSSGDVHALHRYCAFLKHAGPASLAPSITHLPIKKFPRKMRHSLFFVS